MVINGETQDVPVHTSSTKYLVGTQTLEASGQAITVSGTVIGLMMVAAVWLLAGRPKHLLLCWALLIQLETPVQR